jgi:MFS transporter, SP family, general alpha glucoside:H+ symporter
MESKHEPLVIEKVATAHLENSLGLSAAHEAKFASDAEHNETLWHAIKSNRKAVLWSMLISMSIVMEGYDTVLIGNFFGYPSFQRKYGHNYGGDIGYQVSGPWQSGLQNAGTVGSFIGAFMNGYFSSRFGYRWTMITALFCMNAFIFIVFFTPNLPGLLVGEILCGLTWGVFATSGPAYASEVCPVNLRGYLTTYVNLCWAIGQFIAAGVLQGLLKVDSEWSYKIPFAVQWAWPVPLMVLCFFAPESPWFLARKDRLDEARRSLTRLSSEKTQETINGTLAMVVHTITIEDAVHVGSSYVDCFKGVDLRRTEIVCLTFAGQVLSGSAFAYSPTYFFTQAGISADASYKLGLGGTAMAFLGTVISWFLLTYFGRRTLYVIGQGILCTILLTIAIIASVSDSSTALYVQAGFTISWLFVYSLTVGPICYAIISETSAIRLRPQSVCLARNSYYIVQIIANVLQAYFMNPTEWGLRGKTGYFWTATAACTFAWAYFRLPETKGRSYEELDIMFANKVSARQFSKYEVDAYALERHDSEEK